MHGGGSQDRRKRVIECIPWVRVAGSPSVHTVVTALGRGSALYGLSLILQKILHIILLLLWGSNHLFGKRRRPS